MIRKLLFTLTLLLVAAGSNAVLADVTQNDFWRFNRAANYGDNQKDDDAKTLVIKTADELALFAYESIINNGFEGWTITLDADINVSARYWQPIGAATAFKGTFNGNGHTITGVKMDTRLITTDLKNDPATMRYNAFGLFGIVSGTVENLKLASPEIYVNQTPVSASGQKVAALVGKLEAGGTIRNCVVNGGTVVGKQYVGALVGLALSNSTLATIVGCKSSATVSTVDGGSFAGGLVGQLTGNASLRYSLYTGTNPVTASNGYAGLLVGDMSGATATGESESEKNYFTGNLTAQNARDRKAYTVTCTTEGLALVFGPSIWYSQSDITAYENILFYDSDGTGSADPGNYYAAEDDEVIFKLDITDNTKTFVTNVMVNGVRANKVTSDTYSFVMGSADAEVTANVLADNSWDQETFRASSFSSIDNENKKIVITTAEEMGLLAYNVNEGINDYSGWTIEIGEVDRDEISLSEHTWVPIGTSAHPFRGTFDGKGKTIRSILIADTRWASNYTGLFGYGYECTIKGIRLENCMIGGYSYVGTIVGSIYGNSTVEDCNIDVSCIVAASGEYVGGVVGYAKMNSKVLGCVNAAPVQGEARVGGIVGQIEAYTHIKHNIFNGLNGDVMALANSNKRYAYIVGNINTSINNTYRENNYTLTSNSINDYDDNGYSVTSGSSGITLTFDDEGDPTTTYTTSGIKAYTDHLRFNDVYYAPKNASIALTLNSSSDNPKFKNVTASSGTLTAVAEGNSNNSKHTLVLDNENQANCVIKAVVGGTYWTDNGIRANSFASIDTSNKTITISTAAQLGLLAYNVNNGEAYEGYTITLSGDISLTSHGWVPIGAENHSFKGTFDGNGKTIRELMIDDGERDYFVGLFGCIKNDAVIKNVKLTNSNITGEMYVGGIAGLLYGSSCKIENCFVGSNVNVTGITNVGGIVGRLQGTMKGCVSGATVTGKANTEQNNIGGIVGETSSASIMKYNVYNGTSVTGKSCVAAVIGRIVGGTRENNYFITPALKGLNDYDCYAYTISSGTTGMTISLGTAASEGTFSASDLTFYQNGGFTFGSTTYGGDNETVSITIGGLSAGTYAIMANGDATLLKYHGTGFNITDEDGTGWFTLNVNDTNYELTAENASENFLGEGDAENPYLIRNIYEMKQLALVVANGRENYKDKYFRLENDLTYTAEDIAAGKFQPVGTPTNPFKGYFDGNGKTISGINYTSSATSGNEYLGIFGYMKYGSVSHLRLSNCTFTGSANATSYVGGIAAYCEGDNNQETTILDCIAESNVTLIGDYVGGIVGWVGKDSNPTSNTVRANVEGCVSAATVTGAKATACVGGVIGWMLGNVLQVKNCLYTGSSVTKPEGEGGYHAYGVGNYNSGNIASLDIYYTNQSLTNPNGQDNMAYTVTPAEGLIISHVAPTTSYSLTGIQGYTVGLTYNGNYYATQGQTVTFTLAAENDGRISNVTTTPTATITETDGKYSFTIATSNYTVNATVNTDWAGEGTEASPYIIDDIRTMNLLSERSKDTSFEGKYFLLTADLDYSSETATDGSNFTPVHMFRGCFDGNGHSISGVTVVSSTGNAGIFATTFLKSTVKNLTVTNSSFTSSKGHAGGIVGSVVFTNTGGFEPFIQNCHVGSDVTVTSSAANFSAGGIVGNQDVGQLIGCTSAATVSQTGGNGFAGGIVGSTSYVHMKIHDNIYLGSSVTATNGVADAIDAKPTKAEDVYANFYTNANLSCLIGSKVYEYSGVTYTADAVKTYEHNGIIRYDNNLMKYGDNFYSKYQKGDANGDGVINITDYVSIVNKIHNMASSSFNFFSGDSNGDGVINITDAVKVVNIIHAPHE